MSDGLLAKILVERGSFRVDVELACPPGITCVMGPSGSGKSTILGAVAGLAVPDQGRVVLDGQTWFDRDAGIDVPVHHRRLSYMFQGLALFPHMTAQQNVEYGMHDLPKPGRARRAAELLERLNVAHLAHRRPRTFSGGEAQRVALARALAREPKLLLLDEPFSALDEDLRGQLIDLVKKLVAELSIPLLHVTHSSAEARLLADQVLRIEAGKIVSRGTVAEVLDGG
ncbi:MAG: ATP-binding cassette domain-containing protein [Myxococcales bacterium]|nr:ATP-binding cassette domain-containing protein [Myxococcales bacterium]